MSAEQIDSVGSIIQPVNDEALEAWSAQKKKEKELPELTAEQKEAQDKFEEEKRRNWENLNKK